jgi:hypothetical protein
VRLSGEVEHRGLDVGGRADHLVVLGREEHVARGAGTRAAALGHDLVDVVALGGLHDGFARLRLDLQL